MDIGWTGFNCLQACNIQVCMDAETSGKYFNSQPQPKKQAQIELTSIDMGRESLQSFINFSSSVMAVKDKRNAVVAGEVSRK